VPANAIRSPIVVNEYAAGPSLTMFVGAPFALVLS
jgi:hypothetical protein